MSTRSDGLVTDDLTLWVDTYSQSEQAFRDTVTQTVQRCSNRGGTP